jgi:para-nitrobenzyl esterase
VKLARSLAAALFVLAVGVGQATAAEPLVRTDYGALRGQQVSGVQVFRGVPFAQPPVGDLRWREPQPPKPWAGIREATRYSAGCVQEPPTPGAPYSAEFLALPDLSEDCLYLNIWTPKTSGRRPVLVFIHGGAFQAGSTSVPIYDGADLARNGVVVVTVNYRLGVFGYMAHPELTKESPLGSSGNYGLLDMIAALDWVKANIAKFGGDPSNVTVSGQSAGAIAVNQLLAAPQAKGLFSRAIAESGPTIGLKMAPLSDVERGGVTFATRGKVTSMAQFRALPAKEVFSLFRGPANPMPPFFPLPLMDGKVVISDPEIPTNPILSKVPLIVGFNRDEGAPGGPTTMAQFTASVKAGYGAFADRILAAYPHATDTEAARSAADLGRDRQMAALLYWAEQRGYTSGQRVFVYRFDRVYPGVDPARFGSFHTAEVPYIFGTENVLGKATADDRKVSDQIQARWVAFMKSGDPSLPGIAWPDAAHAPGQVMNLGDKVGLVQPISTTARAGLLRDYFAQLANVPPVRPSAPAPASAASPLGINNETSIEAIAAMPGGKAAFEKHMPELLTHPAYDQFKAMSLRALAPLSGGIVTDEKIAAVEAALKAAK